MEDTPAIIALEGVGRNQNTVMHRFAGNLAFHRLARRDG